MLARALRTLLATATALAGTTAARALDGSLPVWIAVETAKLLAPAADVERFGASVSIDGKTALVGAPDAVASNLEDAGLVHAYVRSWGTWSHQATLAPFTFALTDGHFGAGVAICEDAALVSAESPKAVYAFTRTGTTWSFPPVPLFAGGAPLGPAVALDSDTAVVGGSEAAHVFVRSGTLWTEQAKLTASDGVAGDAFGSAVSISGDTAVIGARLDDHTARTDAGSAYVFVRSGTTWSEQAKLVAGDASSLQGFGAGCDVSGDSAAVGAPDKALSGTGSAYVFVRSGTTWSEQAKLVASDAQAGDGLGESVGLDGDVALAGAASAGTTGAGAAYSFRRTGTTWSEVAILGASDGAAGDDFGRAVSLYGHESLIGAPTADVGTVTDAGAAYVFAVCDTDPVSYCTAGTSASGCNALISASGTASASASSGFSLQAAGVEGSKDGLFFFGVCGRQANSWGNGTSYQCVVPPVKRGGLLTGSGTGGVCDGTFAQDLNALWCATCPRPLHNTGAGALVQAQLWYRDPFNTSNQTTSLSSGIEFLVLF